MTDFIEIYCKIKNKIETSPFENVIDYPLVSSVVCPRDKALHKGSAGRLLVCGGSTGLTGAPIMSCQAALRSGAGLVTLACAEELNTIFEIRLTEVMTMPVDSKNGSIAFGAYDKICDKMNHSDGFLIGPGLSVTEDIVKLVHMLISESETPLVIDADGINAVAKNTDILKKTKAPVILTPHIGEFARLCNREISEVIDKKEELAKDFCDRFGVNLVLKSHETVVVSPEGTVYRNVLGNPGMAVGGSGDVLSGIIASFVCQKNPVLDSALAGVFFHSLAADFAVYEYGEYSLIPTDIINYLPKALMVERNR